MLSTKINGKALSTNTYGSNNGVLEKTTYGNGAERQYTYDDFGNLKTVKDSNGDSLFAWYYDSSMTPFIHSDVKNNLKYYYGYDSIGRLITQEVTNRNTGAHVGSFEYTYDLRNNITDLTTEFGGRTFTQSYVYSALSGNTATERYAKDNLPVRYNVTPTRYTDYTYDTINRLQKKTLSTDDPYIVSYSYKTSQRDPRADETPYRTTQISTEVNGERAFVYNYDNLGNITNIYQATADGNKTGSNTGYRSYAYDGLNQLTRENNKSAGETYIYTYDSVGNIKSKKVYNYTGNDVSSLTPKQTITYTYGTDSDAGWKKLLTSYNGEAINYDAIGNPTTYRGATLTWDGRELKKHVENGQTIKYTYDADGLRGSKTIGSAKTTYHYVNGLLSIEEIGDEYILYYRYDDNGVLAAVSRYTVSTGVTSFLNARTNTRGDVVALCNGNGKEIVKYSYDSWGKLISITNGEGETLGENTFGYMNSVRYRGYVYDQETGLYYLQSRYYDPEVGRFLNADDVDYLGVSGTMLGYNAFAYCENEPVNASDPSGKIASKTLVKVLFSVVLNIGSLVLSDVIKYHLKYSNSRWSSVGTYLTTVVSSIYDALVNKGLVKIVISSAAKNIFNQLVDWFIHKKSFSIQTLLNACFNSMINYAISKFFKIKSPQFIRDIKDEARTIGIRGTVKLTEYLNNKIFKINLMNMGLSQLRGVMITLVKATYNYMFNVRI